LGILIIVYKLTLLFVVLGFAFPCYGQQDSSWTLGVQGTTSFSQVGFWRWYEGGISSLSLGVGISAQALKKSGANQQDHAIRLAFGVVRQDGIGVRKSDDLIHLRNALDFSGISIFGALNPAIVFDFRTQFADGYQYDEKDPTQDGVRISGFLSPAIWTQTVGLHYHLNTWLDFGLGIAAKETIVTVRNLRPRYKVDPDQILRWQVGSSGYIHFDRMIFTNVHLKSTLTLFLAFNQQSPDSIWETFLTMKVNSWLQVNAEYTALYDRDLSMYVQRKQSMAIGFLFNFL